MQSIKRMSRQPICAVITKYHAHQRVPPHLHAYVAFQCRGMLQHAFSGLSSCLPEFIGLFSMEVDRVQQQILVFNWGRPISNYLLNRLSLIPLCVSADKQHQQRHDLDTHDVSARLQAALNKQHIAAKHVPNVVGTCHVTWVDNSRNGNLIHSQSQRFTVSHRAWHTEEVSTVRYCLCYK